MESAYSQVHRTWCPYLCDIEVFEHITQGLPELQHRHATCGTPQRYEISVVSCDPIQVQLLPSAHILCHICVQLISHSYRSSTRAERDNLTCSETTWDDVPFRQPAASRQCDATHHETNRSRRTIPIPLLLLALVVSIKTLLAGTP